MCTAGCLGRQFIQCLLGDLRQLHGEAAAMLILLLALLCHLLVVLCLLDLHPTADAGFALSLQSLASCGCP